jgi:4'-phosphopantetheinyl transferase
MAHDAVTFLVDPGIYCTALHQFLTEPEREQALQYQTAIFQQGFVVSRSILKHILAEILRRNPSDIILVRKKGERIQVRDHPNVFISISHTGTWIAISVGKQKLGNDIEEVRPAQYKKITTSPLFAAYTCSGGTEHIRHVIQFWTMVEAYAKLYDSNPYPLLNRCSPFRDADFKGYDIDGRAVFSLASAGGNLDEILVWLDI